MAILNPYNGSFGALLVGIETTEQTPIVLTKADAIPVYSTTLAMDLQFAMEDISLEDVTGTGYLSQVTSAKCTWSFEMPLYGAGVTGTAGSWTCVQPRYVTDVLATAFTVTSTGAVAHPTLALAPTINHGIGNCSFTMQGYFAVKGNPNGGAPADKMLSATLTGCKITKATFSVKADGLHRCKLEGLGVYVSDWSDTAQDLTGANWDAVAQEFIRGMGQAFTLDVNGGGSAQTANATSADITVDFGAEHLLSDGALSSLSVGGVGVTKRDVSISIDPVWLDASTYSIFSVARAGGYFAISSAYAYPAAYSAGTATLGHGIKFDLPRVQFANTTPQRAAAVRAKLDGMSKKNAENDVPLTITLGDS